ncbi:unnamed protein product [Brassicogethes aeneus]|uniref:Cytochrome P450 n=1 Tax=Brassicogethes aeneus TaxID=1431903 RepID=A0A9P0FDW2_BRAAE|nr:unnamed protein product [Brassicogethes aeneus]
MTFCDEEIKFFMKESTFIYCITSFTFLVVGFFILVQRAFSFFEKKGIPRGGVPRVPFGNVKDVIYQECNFNIHLWKYYNRFKRKKFHFAGLYILFKPFVMMMDPFLIYTVLTDKKHFQSQKDISKLFKDEIQDQLLEKYDTLEEIIYKSLVEKSYNLDYESLDAFFVETSSAILGLPITQNKKYSSNLLHYFSLCHESVWKIFTPNSSYNKNLKSQIANEILRRKKNDLRKFDLINSLSENNTSDFEEILDFCFDSMEYSKSITQFCLYELCQNSDIQQEIIGEVRRFRKDERKITRKNLNQLAILDATIKECLRKYPPRATIMKKCCEDFKNEKYKLNIPRHCMTVISVYGVHHDPMNFPNPEEFDPDRFYEENDKYLKSYSFVPFGDDENTEICKLHYSQNDVE